MNSVGGTYTTYSLAEQAFDEDITNETTTKVFSHGGITGSVVDGDSVIGEDSSATGTIISITSTQILIMNISGTFQAEQIYETLDTNFVTSSDTGDGAAIILTIDENQNTASWDGGFYDVDNNVTIQGNTVTWDGTSTGGIQFTGTGFGPFRFVDPFMTVKNFVVNCNSRTCVFPTIDNPEIGSAGDDATFINIIAVGGGFRGYRMLREIVINGVSLDSPGAGFTTYGTASGEITCYSCTSVNALTFGFEGFSPANNKEKYYSSASFGSGTSDFTSNINDGNWLASSDATASTVTGVTVSFENLTMADELVDGANGDVHILGLSSTLIDVGNDHSGTTGINYDIDIITRDSLFDIGADEFVSLGSKWFGIKWNGTLN